MLDMLHSTHGFTDPGHRVNQTALTDEAAQRAVHPASGGYGREERAEAASGTCNVLPLDRGGRRRPAAGRLSATGPPQ